MNDSYMSFIDWVILVVPVVFVMFMGLYSRRYVRGVSDFLACGRLCGRYVRSMGDIAYTLSIIGLATYFRNQVQDRLRSGLLERHHRASHLSLFFSGSKYM